MACGRGDPGLVGAVDGPTVREADAGLFGGQVLDETESRMLAASPVAQFGAGMLADAAGRAAVAGWSGEVAGRIDGWYIAVDLDVLDEAGDWAVAMPEPDGLALETAIETIRTIARSGAPVVGFGATAVMAGSGGDLGRTVDAVAALAEAALGADRPD
jgi:arginase